MDCKYVLSSVFTQSSLLLYGMMLHHIYVKECSVKYADFVKYMYLDE